MGVSGVVLTIRSLISALCIVSETAPLLYGSCANGHSFHFFLQRFLCNLLNSKKYPLNSKPHTPHRKTSESITMWEVTERVKWGFPMLNLSTGLLPPTPPNHRFQASFQVECPWKRDSGFLFYSFFLSFSLFFSSKGNSQWTWVLFSTVSNAVFHLPCVMKLYVQLLQGISTQRMFFYFPSASLQGYVCLLIWNHVTDLRNCGDRWAQRVCAWGANFLSGSIMLDDGGDLERGPFSRR